MSPLVGFCHGLFDLHFLELLSGFCLEVPDFASDLKDKTGRSMYKFLMSLSRSYRASCAWLRTV